MLRLLVALAAGGAPSVGLAGTPPALHYPSVLQTGEWALGLGLALDVLPTALVEAEQRLVPKATAQLRVGLPGGLSFGARLDGVVLTNELRVGVRWAIETGRMAWSLHDDVGLWFGWVGIEGFDTTALGLVQYPGASVGLRLGPHRLSLTAEGILIHGQRVVFGEAVVSRLTTEFGGAAIRVLAESPLGGGALFYGATFLRASVDYQMWLAFSDARAKLGYIQLMLGYAF